MKQINSQKNQIKLRNKFIKSGAVSTRVPSKSNKIVSFCFINKFFKEILCELIKPYS